MYACFILPFIINSGNYVVYRIIHPPPSYDIIVMSHITYQNVLCGKMFFFGLGLYLAYM